MPGSTSKGLRLTWVCVGLLAIATSLVLFFFDPERSGFYPLCLFHRTTGLLCPGCGGLRAAHQLLHGHVLAAFRFNALLVLSLPFAAALGLRLLLRRLRGQRFSFDIRPAWVWAGLIVLAAFGVARNLIQR